MTVDRTHVLATPGMDAHGSYVALSRHRDGMDLHYGRDDFAGQDRLVRTLSRDRAKDMASDYERIDPAQSYAERRGITFRERVTEIVRKVVPEKVRGMFDGLRLPADNGPGPDAGGRSEHSHPDSRSALTARDGANLTSTAGSPTLSGGGRATSSTFSMTSDRGDDDEPETTSRSRHAKSPPTASERLEELLGYPWPFPAADRASMTCPLGRSPTTGLIPFR